MSWYQFLNKWEETAIEHEKKNNLEKLHDLV